MNEIEKKLTNFNELESNSINGWVPRNILQRYMGLKNTAMCQFAKKFNIRTSKIGRLTFYLIEDIVQLLEDNTIKPK